MIEKEKIQQKNVIIGYIDRAKLKYISFNIVERALQHHWKGFGTPNDFNSWIDTLGYGNTPESDLKIKNTITKIILADKTQYTNLSNQKELPTLPPRQYPPLNGRLLASGIVQDNKKSYIT